MELIEKVARAIEAKIAKRNGTFDSRDLSRAAIRAVLEHYCNSANISDESLWSATDTLQLHAKMPAASMGIAIAAAMRAERERMK